MIIVVSGEGPTDIGICRNGKSPCEGDDFVAGAMGQMIEKLVTPIWQYSPLETGAMICLSEGSLSRLCRRSTIVTLPGKNKNQETGYFFKNSYALAKFAQDKEAEMECDAMAVLFRDADGTCSTQNGLWEEKRTSMIRGFSAADFARGVPMLPKPKSEAWLLCALQEPGYQNCVRLESISGNDHSPNSAKKQLEIAMSERGKTYTDASDMVVDGTISPQQIDMPSFNIFRSELEAIARSMVGVPNE